MDVFKNYAIYVMTPPAVAWALYEGSNLPGYIRTLQKDYPQCYKSNENRVMLFIITWIILTVTMIPVQAWFKGYFEKIVSKKKFPEGSKQRRVKTETLAERAYRLFIYLTFTVTGYLIMKEGPYLHSLLFGTVDNA